VPTAFFMSKGMPNLIKSAGDKRALSILKILRKKYDVYVFSRSADYGESDAKALGCKTFLTGDLQNTFRTQCRVCRPDIVILSHWTVASDMINVVREESNAKVYIDTIDLEFLRLTRKLQYDPDSINQSDVDRVKKLEIQVYRKADGIIVASYQDKEELQKFEDFKLIELPCLCDVNKHFKLSEGKNAYIICNWAHDPNIVSTVYLCEKIIPRVDVMFYIVGKHPPEIIKKFESAKVVVTGAEYNIDRFLSKMNMLLCPVFYGAGMNGKILEAASFGIPVVTNMMGARPFSMQNTITAMIGDDINSFVDCVNILLKDFELANTISRNARDLAKDFTIEKWQNKFLKELK